MRTSLERGHLKPRWGTRFEIITDDPFIDNGIYECRGRRSPLGFGNQEAYEYRMIMLIWYKPDGTQIDVSGRGASAYIGESMLRKARRI